MTSYTYQASVNSLRLQEEIIAAGLTSIQYINTSNGTTQIFFSAPLSDPDKLTLDATVAAHVVTTPREVVAAARQAAQEFGTGIINDFAEENIMLGIVPNGMSNTVRKALREVRDALLAGSLRDAIIELRAIPAESKDGTYINDTRILVIINKLEAYLGITPLSTTI